MATTPGITEDLAANVAGIYANAEHAVIAKMATYTEKGLASPDWLLSELNTVKAFRAEAELIALQAQQQALKAALTDADIAAQYGYQSAATEMGDALGSKYKGKSPHAVTALAAQMTRATNHATFAIVDSSQKALHDVILAAANAPLLGVETPADAAQKALNHFADKGITSATYKNGRVMRIEHYVEMSMRTGLMNAALEGHSLKMKAEGLDLVQVSDHSQECPSCREFEGKILSLGDTPKGFVEIPSVVGSGTVKYYVYDTVAGARSKKLFHPNCRHVFRAVVPGVTKEKFASETADAEGNQLRVRQRALERGVRDAQRRKAAAVTPEAKAKASKLLKSRQGALKDHVDTHQLKRQPAREKITGQFGSGKKGGPTAGGYKPTKMADVDADAVKASKAKAVKQGQINDAAKLDPASADTPKTLGDWEALDDHQMAELKTWQIDEAALHIPDLDPVKAHKLHDGKVKWMDELDNGPLTTPDQLADLQAKLNNAPTTPAGKPPPAPAVTIPKKLSDLLKMDQADLAKLTPGQFDEAVDHIKDAGYAGDDVDLWNMFDEAKAAKANVGVPKGPPAAPKAPDLPSPAPTPAPAKAVKAPKVATPETLADWVQLPQVSKAKLTLAQVDDMVKQVTAGGDLNPAALWDDYAEALQAAGKSSVTAQKKAAKAAGTKAPKIVDTAAGKVAQEIAGMKAKFATSNPGAFFSPVKGYYPKDEWLTALKKFETTQGLQHLDIDQMAAALKGYGDGTAKPFLAAYKKAGGDADAVKKKLGMGQVPSGSPFSPAGSSTAKAAKSKNHAATDESKPSGTSENPAMYVGQDATKHGQTKTPQTSPPWAKAKYAAIKKYTGNSYRAINQALWSSKGHKGGLKALDDAFKDPLNKPLDEWTVTTRGTNYDELKALGVTDHTSAMNALGKTYVQDGYMSTSLNANPAFSGQVMLVIRNPPGTRGLWCDGDTSGNALTKYRGEREYLLPRGRQMRVVSVEPGGGSYRTRMVVEIVNDPIDGIAHSE